MTTTTGEKSTNDGQATDQDLDFLASAFEEVATADETDLLASVDPSLVSHFFFSACTTFFHHLDVILWEKLKN